MFQLFDQVLARLNFLLVFLLCGLGLVLLFLNFTFLEPQVGLPDLHLRIVFDFLTNYSEQLQLDVNLFQVAARVPFLEKKVAS